MGCECEGEGNIPGSDRSMYKGPGAENIGW